MAENTGVVVDEAGQIGGKQMLQLIRLVEARQGRLVLQAPIQRGLRCCEAVSSPGAVRRWLAIRRGLPCNGPASPWSRPIARDFPPASPLDEPSICRGQTRRDTGAG